MRENPYYDYDAVRDLSMFFGRREELQKIYNAIEKRQCIGIVGPRHIGKLSLLKFLSSSELQQRYGYNLLDRIFVLTDFREHVHKTREDFFQSICDDFLAQSQHMISLQMPKSSLDGQSRFKRLLQDTYSAGFRPILLMNAFDAVTGNNNFDPHFFSFLRALAGAYDLITYITTSTKPLYEVSHSDDVASSPFFNIFQTLHLGPLTKEEAKELIRVPAEHMGLPFSSTEVDWLLAQAGRHPFFLQVACRYLFDEKLHCEPESIDLERVQERIYQELLPHFQIVWKEDLHLEQRKRLQQEIVQAQHGKVQQPELSESLLFRKHVRRFLSEHPVEITARDVKDALEHFDDSAYLDTCKLAEMHYISAIAHKASTTGATRKGVLVRDFLKAALERMRAGGIRSDTAIEWRPYNILFYHYFKYNLPNQRTAARLSIASMRQFYREQEKALQTLHAEVLAMDIGSVREEDTR